MSRTVRGRKTDRYLVTGACECVGLLGPLLGGGHGYLQGFYGLISDNLISARVVLATGDVISVSATNHSGTSEVLGLKSEVSCLTPCKIFLSSSYCTDFITKISSGPFKEQATISESSRRLQVVYTMSHQQIGLIYNISSRMTRLRLSSV
jgi:hypothetical protein